MPDELPTDQQVITEAPELVVSDAPDASAQQLAPIKSQRRLEVPRRSTAELVTSVAINGTTSLVNLAAFLAFGFWWLIIWLKVFVWLKAIVWLHHGGESGASLLLLCLKMTWLALILPNHSTYAWIGPAMIAVLLLSTGWTTLHLVRNKPLGLLRWPYLILVWTFTVLFPFPAPNLAYSAMCFPDAMWSAVELSRRGLRILVRRTIGEVDPQLETADAFACSAVFLGVCCIPLCVATLFTAPLLALLINAYALLGFLHAFWYRRITRCLSDPKHIRWQSCDVTMLRERVHPVIQVALPNRDEMFVVRHDGQLPIELMQFDRQRPRSARIGFDTTSNRPVAIQLDGVTFPLIKFFFRLP